MSLNLRPIQNHPYFGLLDRIGVPEDLARECSITDLYWANVGNWRAINFYFAVAQGQQILTYHLRHIHGDNLRQVLNGRTGLTGIIIQDHDGGQYRVASVMINRIVDHFDSNHGGPTMNSAKDWVDFAVEVIKHGHADSKGILSAWMNYRDAIAILKDAPSYSKKISIIRDHLMSVCGE